MNSEIRGLLNNQNQWTEMPTPLKSEKYILSLSVQKRGWFSLKLESI